MEISELKSLVRGGLTPDGFSLQAASLASPRVNRLAADYLPDGRFRLAAGAVVAGEDDTSITLRGKGVDLPFRGMPMSLRFSLGAEGAADASLHASAPAGWRLNAAFPPLRGTAAAQLPFAAAPPATLLLSSVDAGGPAVDVAGTVDLAAATGGLAELLGLATVQTRGTARLAAHGGEFHELALTATAAERVDLGLFTVERVTVGVGTELRHDPLRKKTVASSFVRLGATFPFQARGVPRGLPVSATVYDLGGRIRFSADVNDAVDAALDEIQGLLGTQLGSEVHLQRLLPADPGFSLGSVIRLRDLFVDLTPGGASLVELVGIGVESAGTWHLLTLPSGRELTASNVFLDFRVFDPFGTRVPMLQVGGELTFGQAGTLVLWGDSQSRTVQAHLKEGTTLWMDEVFREFVGPDVPVPALEVDEFFFQLQRDLYRLRLDLEAGWEIEVGSFQASFERLRVELSNDPAVTPRVLVAGFFEVAGVELLARAELPAAGQGWTFEGRTGEGQKLPLGELARWLGDQFGVALPDAITTFAVRDVLLRYTTGKTEITFGATGSLELVGRPVELGVWLHVERVGEGAGEFELTARGTLLVSGQEFGLTFEKTPGVTSFRGEWTAVPDAAGHRATLGFNALADLFGFDVPEIPEGMDLALDHAEFTYDVSNKRLELGAHSVNYGGAVFIADASGARTRYLFAVQVAPRTSLRDLPVVGQAVPEALAFSLDDVTLWLASAPVAAADAKDLARLTSRGLPAVPAAGLGQGPTLSLGLRLGEATHTLTLGTAAPQPAVQAGASPALPASTATTSTATTSTATATASTRVPATGAESSAAPPAVTPAQSAAPQDGTSWLNLQKTVGPLSLERIGFRYRAGRVTVLLDGGLSVAGFSFSLYGLQVSSAIKPPLNLSLGLDGLGLEVGRDPLYISGAFLRSDAPGMDWKYAGLVNIRMQQFGLGAVGVYGSTGGRPSLFVFGTLDAPLGGDPALFVMGLSGGLGFNSRVTLPGPDQVQDFPFVAGLSAPPAPPGTRRDPLEVLRVLEGTSTTRPGPAWVTADPGQVWLAAGIQFTSYKLVNTRALVLANLGERDISFALLGITGMQLPPESPTVFARVELQLAAVFKPMEGFLGVSAVLSRNSYLLHPSCRLTGGFAFFLWFAGEHAGDFVLSVGGYHPSFTLPPHYPRLERLGFSWHVSTAVTLKGGAYFALTPSCVMAGIGLEATFSTGNLKAWFRASADFLAQWHPFHFDARVGVSVGVSYRLEMLFTTVTLSVEIGAELHVWGPPTGGEVYVDWYVISFTIPFGDQPDAKLERLEWTDFSKLLPPPDARLSLSLDGVQGGHGGEPLARPDDVSFTTRSAIPATELALATPAGHAVHQRMDALSIRPMRRTGVTAPQLLTVTRDGAVIDLKADGWTVETETQNHPEALWGAPLLGASAPAPSAVLLRDQLAGLRVRAPRARAGATPGPIDVERDLSYAPVAHTAPLPLVPGAQAGGPAPVADAGTVDAIAAGADTDAARTARNEVVAALAALGAAPATAGSLAGVARDAGFLYLDPPLRTA